MMEIKRRGPVMEIVKDGRRKPLADYNRPCEPMFQLGGQIEIVPGIQDGGRPEKGDAQLFAI